MLAVLFFFFFFNFMGVSSYPDSVTYILKIGTFECMQ